MPHVETADLFLGRLLAHKGKSNIQSTWKEQVSQDLHYHAGFLLTFTHYSTIGNVNASLSSSPNKAENVHVHIVNRKKEDSAIPYLKEGSAIQHLVKTLSVINHPE